MRFSDIPDLEVHQPIILFLDVDVDWEMGVDVSHLVFEPPGHADDQVVDDGADCSESSDILSAAVVDLDLYDLLVFLL